MPTYRIEDYYSTRGWFICLHCVVESKALAERVLKLKQDKEPQIPYRIVKHNTKEPNA